VNLETISGEKVLSKNRVLSDLILKCQHPRAKLEKRRFAFLFCSSLPSLALRLHFLSLPACLVRSIRGDSLIKSFSLFYVLRDFHEFVRNVGNRWIFINHNGRWIESSADRLSSHSFFVQEEKADSWTVQVPSPTVISSTAHSPTTTKHYQFPPLQLFHAT